MSFPIVRSLTEINHRGPDDQGSFVSKDGDCHLGHVRLSILDLSSAGRQPMEDASGRYVISYNGEVYNYIDLKGYLQRRHGRIEWKTGTDTEVVLEGFAREGVSFLERLNGIFAISIYDKSEKLLYVLRDPMGIKPLFVTEQSQGTFFCSEMKGLLVYPFLRRTLRLRSLGEQLAFMYVPEPHTLFEEISKIIPGICFIYHNGRLKESRQLFSRLGGVTFRLNEDDTAEALKEALELAVKRQLMGDVPASLFLSGGLDSSAIAYFAVKNAANLKDAYTISFKGEDSRHDAQSDDSYYASLMARELGLSLKVITANRNLLDLLPEIKMFMEDGFSDPAAINTYLICAGARNNGIKVMLSGQGADEYLGGYRRYMAEKMLRTIPETLRITLAKAGGLLPERLPGRFNSINRRLKRLASLAGQNSDARMLGLYTWAAPDFISKLFLDGKQFQIGAEFLDLYRSFQGREVIETMMLLDHHYDLMSLNLCYTDRLSMAVGVETRVPFLDFDLVCLMNSIPVKMKVRGRQGKYIFKKAMESYLPREVIYREKAGFGLPIRAWMTNKNGLLGSYLESSRIRRQGIFDASEIERIVKEHFNGFRDHSYVLFTLLMQQIWLEAKSI